MTTTAAVCVLWFFAVSVSELWYGDTAGWRYAGGWGFDGPHETREACERARAAATRVVAYDHHTVRYEARSCRPLTYKEYIVEQRKVMMTGVLPR